MSLKMEINKTLKKFGYQVKKINSFDPVMEEEFRKIFADCKAYHLQSVERMYALYQALDYVQKKNIPGDIVECGVFKGATQVFAASLLMARKDTSRRFYLYDTFEGWPETKDERDIPFNSVKRAGNTSSSWQPDETEKKEVGIEQILLRLRQTQYPEEKFIFVKGKVEDTLPGTMPDQIALLRLDTDGYESTYQELVHLYPRLSAGGVLILDDFGHWQGAHEAVTRYFREMGSPLLLNRIDYTGRIAVKTDRL